MALAYAPSANVVPFSPMLRAGLTYLNRGWSVIPLRPGTKVPYKKSRDEMPDGWTPYQHRLATEDELMDWCDRWPRMNLAIVTGPVSNLTIVDVDTNKGGLESLAHIRELGIALPPTRIVATPHGWHYYFRYHPDVPTDTKHLPGIDTRGRGGYVVAPPSRLA